MPVLDYTTGEAARFLRMAPRTVSKYVDSGLFPGSYVLPRAGGKGTTPKDSGDRRIPRVALVRFARERGVPLDPNMFQDEGMLSVVTVAPLREDEWGLLGLDRMEGWMVHSASAWQMSRVLYDLGPTAVVMTDSQPNWVLEGVVGLVRGTMTRLAMLVDDESESSRAAHLTAGVDEVFYKHRGSGLLLDWLRRPFLRTPPPTTK